MNQETEKEEVNPEKSPAELFAIARLTEWAKTLEEGDPNQMVKLYRSPENGGSLLAPTFPHNENEIVIDNPEGIKNYFNLFINGKHPKLVMFKGKALKANEIITYTGPYDFEVDGADGNREIFHGKFTFQYTLNGEIVHHNSARLETPKH